MKMIVCALVLAFSMSCPAEETNMTSITGRCHCGFVQFKADHPDLLYRTCDCAGCRRASGSLEAAFVHALPAAFRITAGEPSTFRVEGGKDCDAGAWQYCPRCGSPLFWKGDKGDDVAMFLGTLDAPGVARPAPKPAKSKKVAELTVNSVWATNENNGVDLDKACLLTRPAGIDKWTEDKRHQWLQENGYDLSVDVREGACNLHAVALNMVVVPAAKWGEDMEWITKALQPGSASSPLVFWERLSKEQLPLTFAFRTRSGEAGLFKLVSFSQEPSSAVIQIRTR